MTRASVIYGLVCVCHPERGIRYVGQTIDTKRRIRQHRGGANNPRWPVQHWVRKHGKGNIQMLTLDEAEASEIDQLEVRWIKELRGQGLADLNLTDGGGGARGFTMPADSVEARVAKLRGENHPGYGKPLSQEVKDKISESLKGRKMPQSFVEAMRIRMTGQTPSEETRKKMKASSRKRWDNTAERIRLSKHQMGRYAGEKSPTAKLTNEDVKRIVERVNSGEIQNQVALEYGVTSRSVSNIMTGVSWSHITGFTKRRVPSQVKRWEESVGNPSSESLQVDMEGRDTGSQPAPD